LWNEIGEQRKRTLSVDQTNFEFLNLKWSNNQETGRLSDFCVGIPPNQLGYSAPVRPARVPFASIENSQSVQPFALSNMLLNPQSKQYVPRKKFA
jgi:hypothetical protein